ncbi:Translocon-associated protein beta (TRAPB) [Planctomycetes bacterium CA13]|uniref:Translocon-associated protein beta (TRAPB) n=1 Tax=Novipirellula herctigrandis TaxID=2527986 RepID=A0A5C5ZAE2_9BACT|nr:Translocon-associated protein beta (TRAPB) [Planctomycetes bacterium CA13]
MMSQQWFLKRFSQRRILANLLGDPQRTAKPTRTVKQSRRRLALELLEDRRVLAAAIDLASIEGRIFKDITGDGFTAGEQVFGAAVELYRDNGDGTFNPASGDTSAGTTTTDANGRYTFDRLTADSYFVFQPGQTIDGRTLSQTVSPRISISANQVQGVIVDTIDSFDQTSQLVLDDTNDGIPVTSSVAAPEVIGGERDLFVNKTSINGSVQLSVDNPLLPDLLTFDSILSGNGQRRVTWDGPDGDAIVVDDTGLSGIDMTRGGTAEGIRLQVGADLAGGTAIVRFYTNDGNAATASRFSTATLNIPPTGGDPSSAEFLPFSDFTVGGGAGADITSIDAIELEISGATNVNGTAELVGSIGSTVLTQDFDNFETADLELTKTVDNAEPTVGQNVTFTISVNNRGPNTATGVQVTDLLPVGFTFASSNPSQGTYDAGTGIWNLGSIANLGTATLSLVATVSAVGAKTNSAEITAADQVDADSTPNNGVLGEDDIASVTVSPQTVNIALNKTVDNAAPNVGENVVFTVTASNSGPSPATGVVVRDVLPSGLTLVSATATQGSYNTTNGLWAVGSVVVGATPSLSIVARVNASGAVTNTAEVTALDQTDTNSTPNNNIPTEDDQDSVTIATPIVDLSLTKSVSNDRPNVDEPISFVITLDNAGPSLATGVSVTDILPTGVSFVSSTVSAGEYNVSTGVWTVGDVAVGANPVLTINARIDGLSAITNTASITATDQFDSDSTPGNSVEAEDDQESVAVIPKSIDLSLTKTVDNARPAAGQNVVFTVGVANAGPDTGTGVVVADLLPAGLAFVSATASTGSYDNTTGRWTVGAIAPTDNPQLQITATYNGNTGVINLAEIIAANEFDIDSTPGNNATVEDDQAAASVSPATADLSLTKTVDNGVPNVGENVIFMVTVSNANNDTATGVVVQDLLPANLDFVNAIPSVGDYNATTGRWTIATIPADESVTLAIEATAQSTDLLTNTAEIIAADQFDPDSTPNNHVLVEDDQAEVAVQAQQIDLSLTKAIDDDLPNLGQEVTFTIIVNNGGPSHATEVFVTDQLPAGVTYVSSSPGQGSFNTTTGVWNVGAIRSEESATMTIVGRVDSLGSYTNTAQVTAAAQVDSDSTPANDLESEDDQASVSFRVPVADLSLVKNVNNPSPNVGETVTFRIELTNDGPDAATGVRVTDILPLGTSFISTSLTAGTYDASTGIWNIGTVPAMSMVTLDVFATIDTPDPKTNVARVTAASESDPDSTPGNNVLAEDDQDEVTVTPPIIDLSLTKTASADRPSLGDNVDFTVTVSNGDRDDATGVVVKDLLPDGLTYVSSTVTVGTYTQSTGQWNVGPLASNTSATLTITATVTSLEAKTNVAEVVAAEQSDADSVPGNNVATEDDYASVTITPASADLSLAKTIDNAAPNVGSNVVFTLTAANAGPDAASDVVVMDRLPAGMSFVSASPSEGIYNELEGRWTIPTLPSDGTATLQITAAVVSLGDKTNTAQVEVSDQFDPDSVPGNNDPDEDDQASVTLSPQLVDLALEKIIDEPRPNIGDTIEYTLTLSNAGPSTATGVAVTDLLPTNVVYNSSTPSQGDYNPSTGIWTIGTVAMDTIPSLAIRGVVQDTRGETNTAEVTAVDQADLDSTPGNNVAAEDDQASVAFTTPVADLSLTKTVDQPSPDRGDNVTFTVRVSNVGPDAATDVDVTDQLPPGLQFVSANASAGEYSPDSGLWSISEIAANGQATLVVVASVESASSSTNRAELTDVRQFDPDSTPGNNTEDEDDQAMVTVTPVVVDISVAASVDNDAPLEGDAIGITVNVANAGPANATGVVVRVLIPDGLTLLLSNPESGLYDPATGDWTVGSVAAESEQRLVLSARVDERGVKSIPVQLVATDQFDVDSTPDNNIESEDDETDLIIRAPRLLTKRLFMAR